VDGEVNLEQEATVIVSRNGRLHEVKVLTPAILLERDWKQPGDFICSWSTVFSLKYVFQPVSTRQAFEHAEHSLASLPASVIKSYNDAYLDYLLAPCIEHDRTKEAKRLREALKVSTVWTELRVRVRPSSHVRECLSPPLDQYFPGHTSRVQILDMAVPHHAENPCSEDVLIRHRPPFRPRPTPQNTHDREAQSPAPASTPGA